MRKTNNPPLWCLKQQRLGYTSVTISNFQCEIGVDWRRGKGIVCDNCKHNIPHAFEEGLRKGIEDGMTNSRMNAAVKRAVQKRIRCLVDEWEQRNENKIQD